MIEVFLTLRMHLFLFKQNSLMEPYSLMMLLLSIKMEAITEEDLLDKQFMEKENYANMMG